MREKRWLLLAVYGILLAIAVTDAIKPQRPKFKIATTSTSTTTTEEPRAEENENEDAAEVSSSSATTPKTNSSSSEGNATAGHTLTGIPQIDYIWDPNLPRELNGYNLSDYPFYNSIPEDIDFKCDGLHDGFYASVPHKCQVYHHCLFGTRYDFLCANFTAFDQKTFICHFVSEVDCPNSRNYWHRNDALYKATTTSTTSTSTTTTTTTAAPVTPPRRRRPMRRRPAYEYYDEDYYDDEYSRPRGYDRRDDYEYDERKYRRDRDRDFRDRDFRDRESPRTRGDDRDRESTGRFAGRGSKRDSTRGSNRDSLEDEVRPRSREQEQSSRSREIDDSDVDDRRMDSRVRETDDRRYFDKRYRDEYDDKEAASQGVAGNSDGLVKPAAPVSSVYARPRTPPKIRRPVPLSEQDKYAYKTTAVPSTEEPRRRPVEAVEDDYYDEFEDIRPIRRPIRRRPSSLRERDFYDSRDRDRHFRPRYRDEDEDLRPRKHPERTRDRYYERERERIAERSRDRSLDRAKDRQPERSSDRGRSQELERPYPNRQVERERDTELRGSPRTSSRAKDSSDVSETTGRRVERPAERTISASSTSTTCMPDSMPPHHGETETREKSKDRVERPMTPLVRAEAPLRTAEKAHNSGEEESQDHPEKSHKLPQQVDYAERDEEEVDEEEVPEEEEQDQRHRQPHQQEAHYPTSSEEYSSEYYDEAEDLPPPPPRTAVRIVKRPFLPSRGGNPNPRGLSPVGSKATSYRSEDERHTERPQSPTDQKNYHVREELEEEPKGFEEEAKRQDGKQTYDAYKVIQSDLQQKQRQSDYDSGASRSTVRRPIERTREEGSTKSASESTIPLRESTTNDRQPEETYKPSHLDAPTGKWSAPQHLVNEKQEKNEGNNGGATTSSSLGYVSRGKSKLQANDGTSSSIYNSNYKDEETQEHPSGPGSFRVKQRINEVTHRLQDIPESEYDVTLNEALTPTLNHEANLPSGFVLPLHRQLARDALLQSSENNYKFSRPINQQQQQKAFVPSPQFVAAGIPPNDRQRTVYYRAPEAIEISGTQYRPQRGPWQDYASY